MTKKTKTYRKKVQLLFIGIIVMLFLSYQFSFKKTINSYFEYSDNKEKLDSVQNAPQQISAVQKQLASIENAVRMNPDTSSDFQKMLLEKVSLYCQQNNLVLREFPQTIYFNNRDFEVETNQIVVEGSFIKILKLVYELEQNFYVGKLVSLKFSSQKDYKTGIIKLYGELFFQNFKKIKNE